jgi:molybdate transport system substrate-binding protein
MLCALACILLGTPGFGVNAERLTVLSAASLKAPLTEIASVFESAHPGVRVDISYAGSQQLSQQIILGAPADVFLSADRAQIDEVVKGKRIDRRDVKPIASTRLCLLVSEKAKNRIRSLDDLTQPGVRLCLAGLNVPAGAYSIRVLEKASKSFGPTWLSEVRSKVVSFETNVSAVAMRVELGEVDAGMVYETDARLAKRAVGYEIPAKFNVKAVSFLGILKDSPNLALARAFADAVTGKEGRATFAKFGFAGPK